MSILLDLNDPTAVLLAVLKALGDAGLQAATYGGLALAAYGTPRETKDADLAVAAVDGDAVQRALASSGLDALRTFEHVRFGGNFITQFTLLPGERQTGLNTVDLVLPRSERFARAVLERAVEARVRGHLVRVVTPEDFILLKILSTCDRDLEDASSVLGGLADHLELGALVAEANLLAAEIPDHDVLARMKRAMRTS